MSPADVLGPAEAASSTALLTDRYELTMAAAALADGTAQRRCVFEVFARRLPDGRRYGVVAGTARLLDAIERFRFGPAELDRLAEVVDPAALDWLAGYRFTGDVDGYPEGELYFPGSPILTVSGTFAEAVLLETLALSILNHDCAVASAAARMVTAAAGRPIIEMGSRRTHEIAAVASARATYLAGFAATSNLEAGRCYGVPTAGTAAHAFILLHDDELAAFRSQVGCMGTKTTLLVDTFDIRLDRPGLDAIRIDSGDLGELARQAREQLDGLGATGTRIVLSGDLDEYAIAALRAEPVDSYGVGTSVVTGSGAPTCGMVYKLVEVDGRPVAKRSASKESRGGHKSTMRRFKPTGTAVEEVVHPLATHVEPGPHDRVVPVPLIRGGERVPDLPTLEQSREHLRAALISVPWEGLKLSRGEPAIPTVFEGLEGV